MIYLKVMRLVLTALVLVVLTACGTVSSIPTPKSYTERVAAVYTGLGITNDTAAILVNAGTVSREEGGQALEQTRLVREATDAASMLSGREGEDALAKALGLLKTARDTLCASRPDEPNCVYLTQRIEP